MRVRASGPTSAERTRASHSPFAGAVAQGAFAPLGAGDVDFSGVFAAIDPHYDRWFVVEQDRGVQS